MNLLLNLFTAFFKIGLFSIGGGYAVIPNIQEQVVTARGWISQKIFTDIITISQLTPGPLAVNTSTFVGVRIAGLPGAVLATLGCVISGICLSVTLYCLFGRYKKSLYVTEILKGLKSASLGLVVSAAVTILLLAFTGSSELNLHPDIDTGSVILFLLSMLLLRRKKTGPVFLMLLTGAAGLFLQIRAVFYSGSML